jgi:hypothetical protein
LFIGRSSLKQEKVIATLLRATAVPTICLRPIWEEEPEEEEPEMSPCVNFAKTFFDISDDDIQKVHQNNLVFNDHNGKKIMYGKERGVTHILQIKNPDDVEKFLTQFKDGGFRFELKKGTHSEEEFYLVTPDPVNLLEHYRGRFN